MRTIPLAAITFAALSLSTIGARADGTWCAQYSNWLPIERKGIDVVEVPNLLHVVMLAEPGWVIPAGRYERRYAAFAVSNRARGDKDYFRALHRQMAEGGIEAMFYDLRRMDLGDWHPRDIPDAVLNSSALRGQQSHNLPPLEQWYVMLLHNGVLPAALAKRPSTTYTQALIADAKSKVPRLRELTEVQLRNFLIDEESILPCEKFRSSIGNGWTFPPLAEAREAWERRYGPVAWDFAEAKHWGDKPEAKVKNGGVEGSGGCDIPSIHNHPSEYNSTTPSPSPHSPHPPLKIRRI